MTNKILSFDTSSMCCSVALLHHIDERGSQVLSRSTETLQQHSEKILSMASELLTEADISAKELSAIAFNQGPGAFTGLRVACGVTQGIAFALNIPVVPVVNHRIIAAQIPVAPHDLVVVATDAHMNEIYLAVYLATDTHGWETIIEPSLVAQADISRAFSYLTTRFPETFTSKRVHVAGDALIAYPEAFHLFADHALYPHLTSSAEALLNLAHDLFLKQAYVAAMEAQPLYVRDKIAFTTVERALGLGKGGNPVAQGFVTT